MTGRVRPSATHDVKPAGNRGGSCTKPPDPEPFVVGVCPGSLLRRVGAVPGPSHPALPRIPDFQEILVVMKNLIPALRETFSTRGSWMTGAVAFAVFLFVYLITLPATFTGGVIGFQAFAFLTPTLLAWSVFLAFLLAVLIPMTVYLLRRGYRARGAAGTAAGGLIVSLLTPLLCCSPVLPIAFGFLAGWIPVLAGGSGGVVQGFLATHESLFFSVSALLLMGALLWNAREITRQSCCAVPR